MTQSILPATQRDSFMNPADNHKQRVAMSGRKLFAMVFSAVFLALLLAGWLLHWWLFPSAFKPVELSATETSRLEKKLEQLPYTPTGDTALTAEPYRENPASRQIEFSEREINALIARNQDLAQKLIIDLSDNLISAQLLVPLDADFPIIGGQTLRVSSGIELSYRQGQPKVVLRGISVWGVPLPDAWLGNLKQVDLVARFQQQPGFWQQFADGIANIEVGEGKLRLRLRK